MKSKSKRSGKAKQYGGQFSKRDALELIDDAKKDLAKITKIRNATAKKLSAAIVTATKRGWKSDDSKRVQRLAAMLDYDIDDVADRADTLRYAIEDAKYAE